MPWPFVGLSLLTFVCLTSFHSHTDNLSVRLSLFPLLPLQSNVFFSSFVCYFSFVPQGEGHTPAFSPLWSSPSSHSSTAVCLFFFNLSACPPVLQTSCSPPSLQCSVFISWPSGQEEDTVAYRCTHMGMHMYACIRIQISRNSGKGTGLFSLFSPFF